MTSDQLARRAYRVGSWLLCRLGRHPGARRRDPERAGPPLDDRRRGGYVRMGRADPGPGPLG